MGFRPPTECANAAAERWHERRCTTVGAAEPKVEKEEEASGGRIRVQPHSTRDGGAPSGEVEVEQD